MLPDWIFDKERDLAVAAVNRKNIFIRELEREKQISAAKTTN